MKIGVPEIQYLSVLILLAILIARLWHHSRHRPSEGKILTFEKIRAEKIADEIFGECLHPERVCWEEGVTLNSFVYPIFPGNGSSIEWHNIWARVYRQWSKITIVIEYAYEYPEHCLPLARAVYCAIKARGVNGDITTFIRPADQPDPDNFRTVSNSQVTLKVISA